MRKRSTARFVNGVISAIIVVFFLVHGALGSAAAIAGFSSPFTWLVWCGVALVAAHVIMSVVTSKEQLSDPERPPSSRKKRHLALKWATGAALAAAAAVHIVATRTLGAQAFQSSVSGVIAMVLLCVVLAVHLCVGSRSLLKDLSLDRRYKTAFRVVVCTCATAFALALIISFFV